MIHHASQFYVKGKLSECCSRPENLGDEQRLNSGATKLPYDIVYRVCRNCGRRHFQMKAEEGKLLGR